MYKMTKKGWQKVDIDKQDKEEKTLVKSLESKITEMSAEHAEAKKKIAALQEELEAKDATITEMSAELEQLRQPRR